MTLQEFRHLLNTLPITADGRDLMILDTDTAETFEVLEAGVDVDGTPVVKVNVQ